MQDNWLEILGEITNSLDAFEKLDQKIAPMLAEIHNNSEGVNPELMELYDNEMKKLDGMRSELDATKDKLKNIKV